MYDRVCNLRTLAFISIKDYSAKDSLFS
jgi:hypothetical protein